MKEFKIIIPASHEHKLKEFEAHVIQVYGGFTRTIGAGAWRNIDHDVERETVWIYTVATDAKAVAQSLLACWAAKLFDQDCIYLQHTSGNVQFVTP